MTRSARPHKFVETPFLLSRRTIVLAAAGCGFASRGVSAQMSQRARQIRERRACEQNQPDCRPEIRAQLEEERQRMRLGLGALAVGTLVVGIILRRRYRALQRVQAEELQKLNQHLDEVGGDSEQNQAKSQHHEEP